MAEKTDNVDKLPEMMNVTVEMARTGQSQTNDQSLWAAIRSATDAISWEPYEDYLKEVMPAAHQLEAKGGRLTPVVRDVDAQMRNVPFPRMETYNLLKVATGVFLEANCGVVDLAALAAGGPRAEEEKSRGIKDPASLNRMWGEYKRTDPVSGEAEKREERSTIPYLDIIRRKLGEAPVLGPDAAGLAYGIIQEKLTHPPMIELIWSYWMDEGGIAQTLNAVLWRFQNRRSEGGRDPLANMDIAPLRSLNNIVWGLVQDEQHRLSVARRAYEYDHHYGFSLVGRAVPRIRTADTRSRLLEALNNLLSRCAEFYHQDDDTTRIADGFPVLNALKEVHLLLTQGGSNQYGDLPWTARQEMMMTQWVLARPEMREFLGGRTMVAYAEPWMDRVDAMRALMGWSNTSVAHFRDLAVFGEKILLSARLGAWSRVSLPLHAANWARYFRSEIQGYIHAYRAATGVDVTASDDAERRRALMPPSALLAQRELRAARR